MRDYSQVAHIRKTIEERLLLGASIQEFLDKMVAQAPNTFVELLFEDVPIEYPLFWQTIIKMIPTLEQHIEAKQLYLHLVKTVPEGKGEVLFKALQNHPEALWLIDVSSIVEQENMGYQHLMQKRKERSFLVWCFRYAWRGARAGLIQLAGETGNPVPSAALLRAGATEDAITAAAKALERNPNSPVLEYMAATIGPDISELVRLLQKEIPEGEVPVSITRFLRFHPDRG